MKKHNDGLSVMKFQTWLSVISLIHNPEFPALKVILGISFLELTPE